jgi:hypothetical protein
VDSNNDSGYTPDPHTPGDAEDSIEDDPSKPGKIIAVADGDSDGAGKGVRGSRLMRPHWRTVPAREFSSRNIDSTARPRVWVSALRRPGAGAAAPAKYRDAQFSARSTRIDEDEYESEHEDARVREGDSRSARPGGAAVSGRKSVAKSAIEYAKRSHH